MVATPSIVEVKEGTEIIDFILAHARTMPEVFDLINCTKLKAGPYRAEILEKIQGHRKVMRELKDILAKLKRRLEISGPKASTRYQRLRKNTLDLIEQNKELLSYEKERLAEMDKKYNLLIMAEVYFESPDGRLQHSLRYPETV